jgi:G3E family GTPase
MQHFRLQRIEKKSLQLCTGISEDEKGGPRTVEEEQRVPVTIITGFLGSGKTTLVNRILSSEEHGLRVLVIENELGAISIDHELIDRTRQSGMPEGVIVMKNGCMCCSGEAPGSELERVLDQLIKLGTDGLTGDGGAPAFEKVLIETTGLADPAPIVQVLCRREMENSRFYLDAVITMVDTGAVLRHLRPSGPFGFARRRVEAEKQLALADRIVLNKVDLLRDERHANEVLAAVRHVNASAALTRARHADVPLQLLFDQRAFSSAHWLKHLKGISARAEAAGVCDPHHAASVSCVSLELEADMPLDMTRLQTWLQALVGVRHDDLYRLKGVLHILGRDERFVLHGIHADIHGCFERPWAAEEPRRSMLVVIGHSLNEAELVSGFRTAVAAVESRVTTEHHACAPCDESVQAATGAALGGMQASDAKVDGATLAARVRHRRGGGGGGQALGQAVSAAPAPDVDTAR